MDKRICAGMLAAMLCLTMTGCSGKPVADDAIHVGLPEPSDNMQNMIMGESIETKTEDVTLHYVSGDGTSFSTIVRSFEAASRLELLEDVLDALLFNASAADRLAFLPNRMQILSVSESCGIITVNLSLEAMDIQNDQEYLTLVASISNTLLSMEGVSGVEVLVDGRGRPVAMLPLGVQTEPYTGITPAYAQMSAERDYFLESQTGTIQRNAVLFFPAAEGDYFVPELREIEFDSVDYASGLIHALRQGPEKLMCAVTAVPEGADLLIDNPVTEINSSGERVLLLDFSPTLRNYLALSGIEEWKLFGSITMTLTTFIPELDAVRIRIGGEEVTSCNIGTEQYSFDGGSIHREDFYSYIGSKAVLFVPNASGTIEQVERAVSMVRAQSPMSMLQSVVDKALSNDSIFPEICHDDILGISVVDKIASVNLSSEFYRQSQALDAASERSVIYAIVNTLSELDGIEGVRFFIEGIAAETLSGNIYLKGILLPNPGFLKEYQSTVPEIKATP